MTIRLDDDVLDWFRQQVDDAGGGNYQTFINEALRRFTLLRLIRNVPDHQWLAAEFLQRDVRPLQLGDSITAIVA